MLLCGFGKIREHRKSADVSVSCHVRTLKQTQASWGLWVSFFFFFSPVVIYSCFDSWLLHTVSSVKSRGTFLPPKIRIGSVQH